MPILLKFKAKLEHNYYNTQQFLLFLLWLSSSLLRQSVVFTSLGIVHWSLSVVFWSLSVVRWSLYPAPNLENRASEVGWVCFGLRFTVVWRSFGIVWRSLSVVRWSLGVVARLVCTLRCWIFVLILFFVFLFF